ncbi:hypothetical protein [Streptomyces sp. NPDC096339]|uniref:hypothetical protein n=1 Tax=Streptomyces sp. NPDC096339 TaxID=3366086 RepID=UPI0038169A01
MNESPACVVCRRELWEDELGRYACHPCQTRIAEQLAALAGPGGLYARIAADLAPGAGGNGPRVTGSRSAPVPVRLDALSLIAEGGITAILETWVADWASRGYGQPGTGGRLQYRLDAAVASLRFNLDTACRQHEAIDELATEVARIHRTCLHHAGDTDGPAAQLYATCRCGGQLRFSFDTASAGCRGCGSLYEHGELIRLAQRTGGIAA